MAAENKTDSFGIDPAELSGQRETAEARAAAGEGSKFLQRLSAGEPLDDLALTTLFLCQDVETEELLSVARGLRPSDAPQIETFSPLYISNECDAECRMCGMRRFNRSLRRETADASSVNEQLDILHRRGIRGVALLTGEYHHGARRRGMLARTAEALREAVARSFSHVLINVGSLERDELDEMLAGIPRADDGSLAPHITMCTFQETYDRNAYARFMGTTPENPRSDFERRLQNFDRAAAAGFGSANPGLLLGLNRDLGFELLALLAHLRHLRERGMSIYISLPRLRKASGAVHRAGVSDDDLTRMVCVLSAGVPEAKVVISTRESPEIQQRLLPVIGVLTAGSPGVSPYTDDDARFDLEASQFEVSDQRPFEVILGECLAAGATIDGYEPAAPGVSAATR